MKNYKFLSLFLIFSLLASLLCLPGAAAEAGPVVSANAAVVLDRRSGGVIYSKNADAQVYPASVTKIMTVLLAIEAVERGEAALDDQVTAAQSAMEGLSALGSSAGITAGETMTLEQLLYCALLSSANEACNIIAEHIAGTRQAFIDRMNQRATELGCTKSHFANAHGLPNLEHYATAADYALIALEATRHPLFMEICGTAEIEIPATNKSPARKLHNSNALLCGSSVYGDDYLYPGAEGIKTGHTTAAGYCLASAATRNGVALLSLVFGDQSSDSCFKDTIALYDWAFANYSYQEILSAHDCVGTVPVMTNGSLDYVELYPADDFVILLPNDCDLSEFSRQVTLFGTEDGEALTGPLTPGTVLGRVQLLKNGEDYGSMDLIPQSASALVMDQRGGEILFSKGADTRVYPAELTVLMTALLAVEAVEKGQISMSAPITATDALNIDLGPESHPAGLVAGETLDLEYLLSCAILGGGDDACNVIAEYVSGSVPAFVAQMNLRAAELGCTGTNFTNTHGAYDPEHYTTARDFSLIALEVSRHEQLSQFFSAPVLELAETDMSPARTLRNSNALICDESDYGAAYLYEDATGMKAGYNSQAGYTLAATAQRDGISLLCLVFGGERTAGGGYSNFADAVSVFDQVFDTYSYQEIIKSTENIASVDIALGQDSDYVNLRPSESIAVLLPKDYDPAQFETQIRVYALENHETVTAPVSAGQVLGEVTLFRNGHSCGTVKLEASSSVELSRMQYIKSQLRETTHQRGFLITVVVIVLLFLLYLAWVISYRVRHHRHVKAVRQLENPQPVRPAPAVPETAPAPDISFFRGEGQSQTPPAPAPAPEDGPATPKVIPLHRPAPAPEPVPAPASAPAPKPEPAPTPAPAPTAPDRNDLLREARCVATLAPPPEETPSEKAERDYFEEFFRTK